MQFRLDGFTLSRLTPYERWEPFRDEARRLWGLYREAFKPEKVGRVALRYINRLDVPGEKVELKDYFRAYPEIPAELPQTLSGFFVQAQVPLTDIESTSVIHQAIVEPPNKDVVSIVLDLDLFRFLPENMTEKEMWDFFENLHARKNAVFESCITDRTRELIR